MALLLQVLVLLGKVTDAKIAQWDKGQANVIESIKLNGTALSIDAKAVNIPLVTADTAGIVISSADENTISYANGIGTVNSLNVNKLAQTEGDVLIIDGGKA